MVTIVSTFSLSVQDFISIVSVVIGLIGAVAAYFSTRKESRLKSLSEILKPLFHTMQLIDEANTCRRTGEQLQRAFPNPEETPEAVTRYNQGVLRYNELMKIIISEAKSVEVELLSRTFCFPDNVVTLLKQALKDLFNAASMLNEGNVARSDVALAKLKESYKDVAEAGRGWRLSDPLERTRLRWHRWRGPVKEEPPRFELSHKDFQNVLELVSKRVTSQGENAFTIHPPQILLDHPEIAKSADVIDRLESSVFEVVFQDGTYAMLTFIEFIVFIYQNIVLRQQWENVSRMVAAASKNDFEAIEVKYDFRVSDIVKPEIVKSLLSTITFSNSASDSANDELP